MKRRIARISFAAPALAGFVLPDGGGRRIEAGRPTDLLDHDQAFGRTKGRRDGLLTFRRGRRAGSDRTGNRGLDADRYKMSR